MDYFCLSAELSLARLLDTHSSESYGALVIKSLLSKYPLVVNEQLTCKNTRVEMGIIFEMAPRIILERLPSIRRQLSCGPG